MFAVWVVSLGISLAPQLGWKDPGYLDRIAEGKCLPSQDPGYQVSVENYFSLSDECYFLLWTLIHLKILTAYTIASLQSPFT